MFSSLLIDSFIATVHRYYESRRRLFNDSQPSRVDQVEKVKMNTKKRQQRRKVCVSVVPEYILFIFLL